MRLIRKSTFETNSSSTHALVIPNKVNNENYNLYDSLDHEYCFSREAYRLLTHWDEKLAYIYKVIVELENYKWDENQYPITKSMVKAFKKKINTFYKEIYNNLEYKPYKGDPKPNDIFKYVEKDGKCNLVDNEYKVIEESDYDYPYVDHVGEFAREDKKDFLDKIFNDDEFLKRFIFNSDSYITIGGDEYCGFNIKTIGFQYDYDNEDEFDKKVKEYKKDNYVVFKGN